jgi:hypothetical protein
MGAMASLKKFNMTTLSSLHSNRDGLSAMLMSGEETKRGQFGILRGRETIEIEPGWISKSAWGTSLGSSIHIQVCSS